MEDYVDFEGRFRDLIGKYKDDEYYDTVKDYPKILSVVMGIASDKNSDGAVKMLMNSAIAYFVLLEDVISEKEFGIKGYLDDFFICIYALRELLEHDKKLGEYLISKHWKLEEDYESYILDKYYELSKKIDQKTLSDIISSSGIRFVVDYIRSKKSPKRYSDQKIKDLQRRIHYLFFLFFNRPIVGKEEKRKFEGEFFGTDDFMDFAKELELLAKSDNKFKTAKNNVDDLFNIEERIKNIKIRRLLK